MTKRMPSLAMVLSFVASLAPAALSAQSVSDSQRPAVKMAISAVKLDNDRALVAGFDVKFQNAGPIIVLLNLGEKIGGGKEYPLAVQWTLTDSLGQTTELVHCWNEPAGVAGRIDDFIVTLEPGVTYSVTRMLLGPYCYAMPGYSKPAPGRYLIAASFTGGGQQHPNLDTKPVPLKNFWTGVLRSNSIEFEVGPQIFVRHGP